MTRSMPFLLARLGRFVTGGVLIVLVIATFLPEIRSDRWWIRYAEFVRLQSLTATVVLLASWVALGGLREGFGKLLAVGAVAATAIQGLQLLPFTPLMAVEARAAGACSPERTLRILSTNVRKGNRDVEAVLNAVRSADADLVLLLETDAWWDEPIAALHQAYPYRESSRSRAAPYRMQVLSRLPLTDPDLLYLFGEATPTVETLVTLGDGTRVRFIGLHPRPPLSEPQPTTLRDGSIAAMAKRAAMSREPVVMAGDLNAVPWSPIVRLAKRVAGLEDPRVGRGFLASFDAESVWMRWPLDHILVQDAFSVLSFGRLGYIGSDHYPIVATLCLETAAAGPHASTNSAADDAAIEAAMAAARLLEAKSRSSEDR